MIRRCLQTALAVAALAVACKAKETTKDKPAAPAKAGEPAAAEPAKAGEPAAAEPAAPAGAATKPEVLACDQRDFVAPAGGPPKLLCMDYTGRTGGIGAASCAQGKALDTGCPAEKVISKCTLANGTVLNYYEGNKGAERNCKTMQGTFHPGA